MHNETKSDKFAHLQGELAQQTEALVNKAEEMRLRKRYRFQKELTSQTETLDKNLNEITLLNQHLENIETTMSTMIKTNQASRNPLSIFEKFDFDGDKLLDNLKFLFDLYKEYNLVKNNKEETEETETVKTNINPPPQIGQAFQNPINFLKTIDIEKVLTIISLYSHLFKENKNEAENEDMNSDQV